MTGEICSVSQIVDATKRLLESNFSNILIEGEISNFSFSSAGHYYFTLSDEESSISCAVFRMDALRNPYLKKVKNGDQVILQGNISVYKKRGTFQLIGKRVLPAGKGNLNAQFELLKKKLTDEGLFDLSLKKTIPKYPKRIALITAQRGAALQDMLNVFKRRMDGFDIVIVPAIVQGEQCGPSVTKCLIDTDGLGFDVIVISRGGGSIEDLWGFNDERLVRTIFAAKTPVVSAIGHQVDYTLCDYVADLRCETPTAAAEVLSQNSTELKLKLKQLFGKMKLRMEEEQRFVGERLRRLNPSRTFTLLRNSLSRHQQKLVLFKERLSRDIFNIRERQMRLDDSISTIENIVLSKKEICQKKLDQFEQGLHFLNPKNVLDRGYSYLNYREKAVESTSDFDMISPDQELEIIFVDGKRKVRK